MTVQPHKLIEHLWNREDIVLQGGGKPERVTATRAMALAEKGLIEGVIKGRALKFVRWLAATARPDPNILHPKRPDEGATEESSSHSTAFARTNMGVYRQPMREAIVIQDIHGRRVVGEGDVTGYCYSFCSTRKLDTADPQKA